MTYPRSSLKVSYQVVSVRDLNYQQSLRAALKMRKACHRPDEPDETYRKVVDLVGGRLAYLNKVARQSNMVAYAGELLSIEKAWLQSQIGLIPDHDDDVMDEVRDRSGYMLKHGLILV